MEESECRNWKCKSIIGLKLSSGKETTIKLIYAITKQISISQLLSLDFNAWLYTTWYFLFALKYADNQNSGYQDLKY